MSCIDFDQSSWIALHTFIMSLNAKLSVVARMVSFETLWHHKILEFWRFFLSSQISRPYLISSHSTLQPTVTDPVPVVASLSGEIWAILVFFLTQRSTLELNVCSVSRWTFPLLPVRLLSACVFPTPGVGLVSSVPPQKKKKIWQKPIEHDAPNKTRRVDFMNVCLFGKEFCSARPVRR